MPYSTVTWGAVNSACVTLTPVKHPTAPTFPKSTLITSGALHHIRGAFHPVRLAVCSMGAQSQQRHILSTESEGALCWEGLLLLSLSAFSEERMLSLRPRPFAGNWTCEHHVGTSDSLGSTREVGLRPHCKLGSQDPEAEGSGAPRLQA